MSEAEVKFQTNKEAIAVAMEVISRTGQKATIAKVLSYARQVKSFLDETK